MSGGQGSNDLMQRAAPVLLPGLEQRRNADGELVLVTPRCDSYLTIADAEAAALSLLDGERTLQEVARAAIALPVPLRPMATLSLVRRLAEAGMLVGARDTLEALGVASPSTMAKMARLLRRAASIKFAVPLLGLTLNAGKLIPAAAWPKLSATGITLFIIAILGTLPGGHLLDLFDPFHGDHVVDRTVGLYVCASLLLTLRDMFRGLAFTSLGLAAPSASISLLCGVIHIGIDDHPRRAATESQRSTLAWAGIAGLGLLSAVSIIAWLAEGHDNTWLRALASTGLYLALFNAAPYARGDVWHLIGITTRIPNVTQRAGMFLFKRSVRNLTRDEPIRRAEQTYLTMSFAWLAHWIMSLWLVTAHLMPGALRALQRLARGHTSTQQVEHFSSALGLSIAAVLMCAIALLALGLVAVIFSAAMQLLRPERATPPLSSERIGDADDAMVDEMQRVPFLANLPRDELASLVAGMRREKYDAKAVVVRQGDRGDRFCFLHAGECIVEHEEESGIVHTVATLQSGDFFGEIALLEQVPRTATVRTTVATEVYSLDRETFVTLVEHSTFAREAVLDQVRNAAFLRTVPVFHTLSAKLMATLLAGVDVVHREASQTVVTQGERGDVMYVIREGSCDVTRARAGKHEHITSLGPGDWFGEIALLRGIERTATVRTTTDAVLVSVPGDVLDDVLLEDFQIGVALEQAMAQRLVALEMQ